MTRHTNPRDRESVQSWAQQLFELPNFYVIDTETTGFRPEDEVVQIGVMDKQGNVVLDTLVKPTRKLSKDVIAIHGITNERLASAPSLADLYTDLSIKLAGVPLVAYNMDFDWRLLQQTFTIHKLPIFRSGARHCAMKQYAQYRGQRGRSGYKWHKLSEAASYEKILVKDAHTALGDVRMTLALLQKMAEG